MKEEWKDVVLNKQSKYSYKVSSLGRVLRIFTPNKQPDKYPYKEELVAINYNKQNGYCNVCIATQKQYLHRLVAKYFCDGYSTELEVNHKDGDKSNNIALNLEWVTRKENMEHASEHNLINRDSEKRRVQCSKNAKKSYEVNKRRIVQLDDDFNVIAEFESIKEGREKTGININRSLYSDRNKDGGYRFMHLNKYFKLKNE